MFNVMEKAIPGGLTDMMVVGALVVSGVSFAAQQNRRLHSVYDVADGRWVLVLYKICQPLNRF